MPFLTRKWEIRNKTFFYLPNNPVRKRNTLNPWHQYQLWRNFFLEYMIKRKADWTYMIWSTRQCYMFCIVDCRFYSIMYYVIILEFWILLWSEMKTVFITLQLFFIRKISIEKLRQKIGKIYETLTKHKQVEFQKITWKNCFIKKILSN